MSKAERKIRKLEEGGKTTMILAVKVLGLIAVADTLNNTIEAVQQLQKRGLEVYMMTGDNQRTARLLPNKLGLKMF